MKVKQSGFTLVELMITVTIIGILTGVGYPSYTKYIQKSKRSEAQAALVSMATAMEQWRIENNNSYAGVTVGTGATAIFTNRVPTDSSGTKTYDLSLVSDVGTYTLTATPVSPQDSDSCGTLTLDSTGVKGAALTSGCWE